MNGKFEIDRRILIVFLTIFFYQSVTANDEKAIVKQMDLAICLGKFDVKNDMIIRTEESRKLGAKFLVTVDVGSQVECLHLCCETENCDVFVFEEKGQGACFLFHCGPAQNFRCKFSKHANYTSAVFSIEKKESLKPNHSVTLSQNELELKSLKGKPSEIVKVQLQSGLTTTATQKPAVAEAKNVTFSPCGRFQFQCHSGDLFSHCIALYNVCDGIPQCEDGSDEGPECQSMNRSSESKLNKPSPVSPDIQTSQNNFIGHNREDPLSAPQWPNQMQFQPYKKPNGLAPDLSADQKRQLLPYQDQQQQINSFKMAKGYPGWGNIPEINWPQQMPQFPSKPLEAFQSKSIQQDYLAPGSSILQTNKEQQFNNWPVVGPNLPNIQNVAIPSHPNQINEEVLPEKTVVDVVKDVTVSDRKKDGKNTFIQMKTDSTSSNDSDYNDEEDETTTEPPKKKNKHRKVNKTDKTAKSNTSNDGGNAHTDDTAEHQLEMIRNELQTEFLDHDGKADRPSGAYVSLCFGILITIALLMVISCRTTTVRKRIRRGGKGYAHDADFLVNGMYL